MSTLPRYDGSVLDNVPRPVPNAQVFIYTQPMPFTQSSQTAFAAGWSPNTVSLEGASLATVYNDNAGANPVTQPLQYSNTDPTFDGNANFYFYAVGGLYAIVMFGGTLANPIFLFDQNLLLAESGGALFQTNGVTNSSQTLLNLIQGSNIIIGNTGGNTTITGTAAPITFKINGTNASSQVVQNLINGTGITISDGGSGNITINSTAGATYQVNGTPTTSQSVINFESGANVTVSNPSAGNISFVAAYPTFQTNSVNNLSQTGLNLVNSATIAFTNGSGNQIQANLQNPGQLASTAVTLTSAQILALNTTPVQILAAAGTGTQFKLVNIAYEFEPVTTPYATLSKNDLSVYIDTGKATIFKADSTGLLDQTVTTYEDSYALVPSTITFPNPVIATYNSPTEDAAISGQSLVASLPATGAYRISWSAVVTTPDGTSSTLGGSTGFQVVYTDGDTNASATTPAAGAPTAGSNLAYSQTNQNNTIGTQASGVVEIYAKTGTALTFNFGYTSSVATTMKYVIHVRVEYVDGASSVSLSKFFTTDTLSTNQPIMIANTSGSAYTAGNGTLTVTVYYEILATV